MPTLTKRLLHYAVYAAAAVVIAVSGTALYLRLVIMPHVTQYKADIESLAGKVIGVPLSIGSIEADWWGLNPRFSLRQVELVQSGRRAPLSLSRVDATLSWLSLFAWDARLVSPALYAPELEVRRDAKGVIYVADIPVNQPGPRSPFPDWLLRQRHVLVSDGILTWKDDMIGAPPLELRKVNLILRNRAGRHQLGLTARPPQDSVASLDVRADLTGHSVHAWPEWDGKLYVRADGASVEALHRWAPWAQDQVRQGRGAVRFWADLHDGQVIGLTGDVGLTDVAVSLARDLPDMSFKAIAGRLGWSRNRDVHTFVSQGLRFTTAAGQTIDPANVRVQARISTDGRMTLTSARADNLRLEALTALSGAIPMPKAMHDTIEKLNPRGFIEHAQLDWENFDRYKLTARFRDAGMNATATVPGITGLSGRIVATGSGGEAQFSGSGFQLDYDRVFRHPLIFDRLVTDLVWERLSDKGLRLKIGPTLLNNADLDASAEGSIEFHPQRATVVDLQAHATRGAGNAVWRYLPRKVGDHAYNWLKRSLIGGTSPDTRMVLKGPLDQFPFDKGGGEFYVAIKAKDAKLSYAPDWPMITGINGEVLFKGNGMRITAQSGQILGVNLGPASAVIPDLHSSDAEMLNIDGQARGATPAFLEFIRQSPVNEHTGHFTERLRTEGQGVLQLRLRLPLRHLDDTTVRGDYRLTDNTVHPGKDLPPLTQVSGVLSFTENLVRGDALSTRVFGLPAKLRIASESGGRVRVVLNGQAGVASLKEWLPSGLDGYLSGSTDYEAEVSLKAQQTTLKLKSELTGLSINLPAPLNKTADQAMPFLLTSSDVGNDTHVVGVQYGSILAAKTATTPGEEQRVAVYFGGGVPSAQPRDPGISLQGSLRRFDLDAWQTVSAKLDTGAKSCPSLRAVNLSIGELRAFNRVFHDTRVKATPIPKGWKLNLNGNELLGEVIYAEAGGLPGKRLSGHFQKLVLPAESHAASATKDDTPTELPRILEINTQSFAIKDREIGQLNTMMEAERSGLRTRSLVISNPDGRLQGSGWISASHRQATQLDLELESANAGKLLARLGLTEGIKGGATTLTGNISWLGRPEDFALQNLDGRMKLRMKSGRFSQLDPGAGRLLGILSLQALPRRIVLDFRDVFSEGFAFDSIEGDVHIQRGIAYLPDMVIKGPAAVVRMKGKIDLAQEEQDLRVTIQPRLDEGLAMAGALLGGPVVGVGTLVATKILQNPVSKAATHEYLIKGTCTEPLVSKLARPPSPAAESPLTP
jgi:uncharacterized protein (TIGR02099 family)